MKPSRCRTLIQQIFPRFEDEAMEVQYMAHKAEGQKEVQLKVAITFTVVWVVWFVAVLRPGFKTVALHNWRVVTFYNLCATTFEVALHWACYFLYRFARNWMNRHADQVFLFVGVAMGVLNSLTLDRTFVLMSTSWAMVHIRAHVWAHLTGVSVRPFKCAETAWDMPIA